MCVVMFYEDILGVVYYFCCVFSLESFLFPSLWFDFIFSSFYAELIANFCILSQSETDFPCFCSYL